MVNQKRRSNIASSNHQLWFIRKQDHFLRESISYRGSILQENQILDSNGVAYMKFYNFLLKCEKVTLGPNWNFLDTPKMMCLILSKLPGNIREEWNWNVMNIRRRQLRDPDFADIIHFVDPLFSKKD